MNKRSLDWRYLGKDMLLPVCTLGGALVVLALTVWFHGVHENQYAQYSTNQRHMHSNYDALVVRKRILDKYHQRYHDFHKSGFVGRESRLDWVESIRAAADDLNLPNVTYTLDPQVPVAPPVTSARASSNMQIHASSIKLDIGLLHELDLLRFFDKFQNGAPGIMKVDECAMMRQGGAGAETKEARITATCKLSVFSVVTSDISASGTE